MRITQRLELIKLVTIIGIVASVLLSFNLWGGERYFPKAAFYDWYTGIKAPYDYINLIVLLALLIASFFTQHRAPVTCLIFFSIYLCVDDQNRLQPWFYNYMLILFILLFYRRR